jgi:hypothetical protein
MEVNMRPLKTQRFLSGMTLLFTVMLLILCQQCLRADEYNPDWGTLGVFTDAQTCATCHRASIDQDPNIPAVLREPLEDSGKDISSSRQWRHSMMAHALNDPYYQAKVTDEAAIFPELAGFIEDKCLTCHAPMARTHAHQSGTDLLQDASCPLPDGCYRLDTAVSQDHAREGVSCTLCHQIREAGLGTSSSFSGEYSIAEAGDPDALTIYGPYSNPVGTPMQNNTLYTPVFGVQTTSSDHCSTCHTLFTPTLDADTGSPTGNEFLEQGPYLEWQNSLYATGNPLEQQCQDCHMPDPDPGAYTTRSAIRPNGTVNEGWPERSPFFTHGMVGGNTYMLELLRDNRTLLEIANSTTEAGFDEKITETRSLLENRSATLAIPQALASGNELTIDVLIGNQTGHKLPTGFPSRRMWVHLKVTDPDNQVIFDSGAPDASGKISTDAARLDPDCLASNKPPGFSNDDCFEPHRDVIDDDSSVAIYETVMGDTNDHITHVLLHASTYLKDNRIPPAGFTNARADSIEPQTKPAGIGNDSNFNWSNNQEGSGTDTVRYRVETGRSGTFNIEAQLLYQSVQPAFVDSMHTAAPRVDRFKSMVAQTPPRVEVLATTQTSVTLSEDTDDGGDDTSTGGSSGGGGCTYGRTAFY